MKIRSKWVQDIAEMQEKYGVRKWVEDPANKDKLKDFMAFRLDFIEEEFEETILAFAEQDPEFLGKYKSTVPERRMVTAQEVSNAIVFLLGDKSKGITGTSLVVDSGKTIW